MVASFNDDLHHYSSESLLIGTSTCQEVSGGLSSVCHQWTDIPLCEATPNPSTLRGLFPYPTEPKCRLPAVRADTDRPQKACPVPIGRAPPTRVIETRS